MSSVATVARELVLLSRRPADELASWLREVEARAHHVDPGGFTFLLVTPLGWKARDRLLQRLEAGGVHVASRLVVPAWPRVASAVRLSLPSSVRLRRAALFEAAWESLYPATPGEAWALPPGAHARAVALKASLRRELPGLTVDLGDGWPTLNTLHALHLADRLDAREEARRLIAALELLGERGHRRAHGPWFSGCPRKQGHGYSKAAASGSRPQYDDHPGASSRDT